MRMITRGFNRGRLPANPGPAVRAPILRQVMCPRALAGLSLASTLLFVLGCKAAPEAGEVTVARDWAPASGARIQQAGNFYIGSQPSQADLLELRGRGVRTVIDLRAPGEDRGLDEDTAVRAAGMTMLRIPVTPGPDRSSALLAALDALQTARKPLLVHCASGERAAAVWALHLALHHGRDVELALSAGEALGLRGDDLRSAVREIIEGARPSASAGGSSSSAGGSAPPGGDSWTP